MPTEDYSHMVTGNKNMVGGDGVGDDGGEDPLSGMESRINLAPKTKIGVVAVLRFAKRSVLLAG